MMFPGAPLMKRKKFGAANDLLTPDMQDQPIAPDKEDPMLRAQVPENDFLSPQRPGMGNRKRRLGGLGALVNSIDRQRAQGY